MSAGVVPESRPLRRDVRQLLVLRNRGWVRWGYALIVLGMLVALLAGVAAVRLANRAIPGAAVVYAPLALVSAAGILAASGGWLVVRAGRLLGALLVREPVAGLQRAVGGVLVGAGLGVAPLPLAFIEFAAARLGGLDAVLGTVCLGFPLLPVGFGLFLDVLRGWVLLRRLEAKSG